MTQLLWSCHGGDEAAAAELCPLVYQELRALARRRMYGARSQHTLAPTALVHEAYLKMMGGQMDARDRIHFFALAARSAPTVTMRTACGRVVGAATLVRGSCHRPQTPPTRQW